MRVLFAGGGTAGHINPALAIAGYLREREPDAEILYIGAKGGMEERLVPAAGYPFQSITISGFQRKLSWENLKKNAKTVVRMFTSSHEARKIFLRTLFQISECCTDSRFHCPVLQRCHVFHSPMAQNLETHGWQDNVHFCISVRFSVRSAYMSESYLICCFHEENGSCL